jgi:hypothetical protein
MEVAFPQEAYGSHFDGFMRHYLTFNPAYSPNPARLAAIGGFRGRGGLCPGF